MVPGAAPLPLQVLAVDRHRERHGARGLPRRLRELDLHLCEDVGAPRSPGAGSPAEAAEELVAEEHREDVRQVAEVGRVEAAGAQALVAEAVVQVAGLALGEDLVGLCRLPEALLRLRVVVDVGMELTREPAERGLDRLLVRAARNAEDLVVVAPGGCHGPRVLAEFDGSVFVQLFHELRELVGGEAHGVDRHHVVHPHRPEQADGPEIAVLEAVRRPDQGDPGELGVVELGADPRERALGDQARPA